MRSSSQDCFFNSVANIGILRGHELIALEGFRIVVIDFRTNEVVHIYHLKSAMNFEIYEFDQGYVVYGEFEIIKLSATFDVEWVYEGGDIFVRFSGGHGFEIKGGKIYVTDWCEVRHEIDRFGNGKLSPP